MADQVHDDRAVKATRIRLVLTQKRIDPMSWPRKYGGSSASKSAMTMSRARALRFSSVAADSAIATAAALSSALGAAMMLS